VRATIPATPAICGLNDHEQTDKLLIEEVVVWKRPRKLEILEKYRLGKESCEMQGTNSESADLTHRLVQAEKNIELLRSELVEEKEFYSAYYLDLFLKRQQVEVENAKLLKSLMAEKATLVEQNSTLWKNVFALLKSNKKQ
jgi:hypothetical protein